MHLIDFAHPRNNEFLVISQFTITGSKQPRRPDLAVIELKNPANEQTDVWDAFNQLQTYKDEISDLFTSSAGVQRRLDGAGRLAHGQRRENVAVAHPRP